jgi:hypothetical protein
MRLDHRAAGKKSRVDEADSPGQAAMREALRHAAAALTSAEVAWALTGGYALYAYGAPEPTHDVDLVVPADISGDAARHLAQAGFAIEHPAEDWLFKAHWNHCDEPAMVDVITRLAGRTVDQAMIDAAPRRQLLAIDMPVLAPDVVLWAKLRVLDEHYCDFAPLFPAARAVREQVDWQHLRERLADNAFAMAFLDLLERLDVISR